MTAFQLAERLVLEIPERPGTASHPFIVWCHESCNLTYTDDDVPWCSSFLNRICWLLRLPRSKSAMARSWLDVGQAIRLEVARPENDVVILKRGAPPAGHVGLYAGTIPEDTGRVRLLGGNQSNNVTIASFPIADILGIRRLR
jgi:uncharacterized protein (TIGR02594 family)